MKYFKLLIYNAITENINILNFYDLNSSEDIINLNTVEVSKNLIGISMEKESLFDLNDNIDNNIEVSLNKEDFKNYLLINLIKKDKDNLNKNENDNLNINVNVNENCNHNFNYDLSENFMKENYYFFQKAEQDVINYY
jgi:hypothetical protein